MQQSDLEELPTRVRERYNALTPDHFEGHPEVIALRNELREAEALCREPQSRVTAHRERQAVLFADREEAIQTMAQIDANRPARLARLLMTGGALTEDDTEHARRGDLAQFIERVDVAEPAIEATRLELERPLRLARHGPEAVDDKLRDLLEKLRLEEARRGD
jgi:hypothetical protein